MSNVKITVDMSEDEYRQYYDFKNGKYIRKDNLPLIHEYLTNYLKLKQTSIVLDRDAPTAKKFLFKAYSSDDGNLEVTVKVMENDYGQK